MHSKPVPTFENGLVDLGKLGMYLYPNPEYVPLYKTRGWEYHHIYHPKTIFGQKHIDGSSRDQRYVRFRNFSYNQIHLRQSSEETYHLLYEQEVPIPPETTVEAVLRDFNNIDILGATTLTLAILRGSSLEQKVGDSQALSTKAVEIIPMPDRKLFLKELREDARRELQTNLIIPEQIVTGAIHRLALHLQQDKYLATMANRRLSEDPDFYPVRMPSYDRLQSISNEQILNEFSLSVEQAAA